MIIKSLARKRPGFRQLIGYFGRDTGPVFSRNLYGAVHAAEVAQAFEANHALLPKRKNGNALYHEVIVLPPQPGLSRAKQAAILKQLAERYCELRASGNLAWGRIHQDTDNSHIHLMISANAAQSKTRTRLSKARFAEIQAEMEREARARFPELQDKLIYDHASDKQGKTMRMHEAEMQRAGKKPTRKATITHLFENTLRQSQSSNDLKRLLGRHGLEIYQRGRQTGIRDVSTGARYRLTTLGLSEKLIARQQEWGRDRIAPGRETPPTPTAPKDPRAADLLRARQAQSERADRLLRDFDPER